MKRVPCLLLAAAALAVAAQVPAGIIRDKLRGGLLGHILGDLNGLRHENRYIAEPGNVERYVPELPEGAWTDDDTDVEWIYVLEMQRTKTLLIPPARIAELWKRHINRRIWCSHLYLRQLLDIGILPNLTGSALLNPWAGFNLSGQFVSESWGLISPGMPQTAARIGVHYTHVSVDGEPIQATQLFTAMIATAYFTGDVQKIVEAGLAATDPASDMHRIVRDVRIWHARYPRDWRATRKLIRQTWSVGNPTADRNGVKLNGASTVAALLYGRGDFVETVRHAFNFGWDADNNAATAGAIAGVIHGYRWMMDQGWNIRDVFRNTSRDDMPTDETITSFGDRLIELCELNMTQHGGGKIEARGRPVYRIRTEKPANVERLPDAARQFAELRQKLGGEIQSGLERGTRQERARAAYLAIALDLAPGLRAHNPGGWSRALVALSGYPNVLRVLFSNSPVPDGDRLRAKAVAAGLEKPPGRSPAQE